MFRGRARCEADLANLQLPADVKPGQQLAIKQVSGVDKDFLKELAEHEEEVLMSLASKAYVPRCYGLYCSGDEGSADVPYCGNLVVG